MDILLPIYLMFFGMSYHTDPYYSNIENASPYHTIIIFEVMPLENKGFIIGEFTNSYRVSSKILAATFRQKLYNGNDFSIESKQVIGVSDGYDEDRFSKNGFSIIGWAGYGIKHKDLGLNLAAAPSLSYDSKLVYVFILTFSLRIN